MILENELLKKKLIITREHSQTYRRVNTEIVSNCATVTENEAAENENEAAIFN